MQRFTASVAFDRRLAQEDIAGSRAHAAMLRDRGVLPAGLGQAPARQASARRRSHLFGDLFYIGVHLLKWQALEASFE